MNRKNKPTTPWPVNPLTSHIRIQATDILQSVHQEAVAEQQVSLSLFDLAIQVMLVSCSYDPAYIWQGSPQQVGEVARLLRLNAVNEASELMEDLLQSGEIHLNVRAITRIAEQQAGRLIRLRRQEHENIELPLQNNFAGFTEGAELANLRLVSLAGRAGPTAEAIEKRTNTRLIFRQVDAATSRAYAQSQHYLHTARQDETLSFGVFRDDEQYPFAWVSYSRAGRKYKQCILQSLGVDYDSAFELTRAWNDETSPKNTMSMLYAFAHATIQDRYLRAGDSMGAIITTVNPNLGFVGSAFRAVGFSLVAEKPTQYFYAKDRSGMRYYITRRSVESGWRGSIIRHNFNFPLLSSKELVVLLLGSKRLPALCSVKAVDPYEYDAG